MLSTDHTKQSCVIYLFNGSGHCHQRMNSNDFDDPLNFHLASRDSCFQLGLFTPCIKMCSKIPFQIHYPKKEKC